ncbi:DUF6364 family protein [Nonlabens marinus]|uniref:Uncharacterized protein n=1 Tax=Nonlabens marinus S1-08 TaxID=1454201 RepID=W8VPB7_9FLAO|nr:DUF6364 family protein [Nonlabens marinus]BAO54390.1 hypothetical protein NMS_0381 [Nonlabens marinus S1-08]
MKKKLTLSIDEDVIQKAKQYAQGTDRSLSELIESYLARILSVDLVQEQHGTYRIKDARKSNTKPSKYDKHIGILKDWDVDPVKDKEKIRAIRYEKYLK